MDWILRSPQLHSTFSNLGYIQADGYHVNENCNSALEEILQNIIAEDKNLRNYRRNISFGQNIQKDLIPLLIHTKDDKTVDLIIRILVNLTVPIECLLNIELIARTDFGRHTIFEINNLLASTKVAFTELRISKVVVDFLKKNIDAEPKKNLSEEQLTRASNCLLLLRNILHIPEINEYFNPSFNGSAHSVQNQILWNIFSQSFDKVIIKAMTISDSKFWAVTMVQLVALLYKDQHIVTIHKLLNNWLEASISESSEDNESNTSPPDRGSSSPMLTFSDPTSDSSDNGSKAGSATCVNIGWENDPDEAGALDDNNQPFQTSDQDIMDSKDPINLACEMTGLTNLDDRVDQNNKKQEISEASDCGYGTQIENQESVSTSSNDDDLTSKKPVHQKPHNAKQRPNSKPRPGPTIQERKRKKIVKRVKANVINVQGLSHKTPTDEDITNVIKEFTVDFLIKGYNTLVQTLHNEILTNRELLIDTSHFFWLVTYFLKFATQIELDLELVDSVLCFEIVSYLTAEGVNLCEQFELAIKLDGNDLSPNIRRQHLVVTSIREFVQAIEVYKKIPLSNEADHETLKKLQIKMCETEDLRSLMVLLLRHYNPRYHSKQYLQDLVVTNHMLMMFLDNVMKIPEYNCSTKMIDHIRQFATPAIMAQYGLLLEDFLINGEFVNDCIFTLMHHIGGDVDRLITLFQPNILKTFTTILKADFEVCDDWSDLIENVINTCVKKPGTLSGTSLFLKQNGKENKLLDIPMYTKTSVSEKKVAQCKKISTNSTALQTTGDTPQEGWTDHEIIALNWNYLQCSANPDVISVITKQLKDDHINKSRTSVIKELFRQNRITKEFYESQLKREKDENIRTVQSTEFRDEEIGKACEHSILDVKSPGLEWVQRTLLEICYAKLLKHRKELQKPATMDLESKFKNFECFRNKYDDMPIVSPVAYHSLIMQESVPLVPWNCHQANMCKDLKFLQVLHKLGFQMPVDTGRVFIRIPHFWTAEFMYTVAGKIKPIDKSMLKFSVCEMSNSENGKIKENIMTSDVMRDGPLAKSSNNLYQIHKQNSAIMVNFMPRPADTFTSANAIEQLTWLQIVKKSQQCKLTLNLESASEATTEDTAMEPPAEDDLTLSVLESEATKFAGIVVPLASVIMPTSPVMLPSTSVMQPTTSVKLPSTSIMQTTTSIMLPSSSIMQPTISVMLPSTSIMQPTTSVMQSTTSDTLPTTSVMLPTIPVLESISSVTLPALILEQETAPYNVQREDYCNGACETASVASDLTRMYVSDEDEKPDITLSAIAVTTGDIQKTVDPTAARHKIKHGKRRRMFIKNTS